MQATRKGGRLVHIRKRTMALKTSMNSLCIQMTNYYILCNIFNTRIYNQLLLNKLQAISQKYGRNL